VIGRVALALAAGFLLGSIPFGLLLSLLSGRGDPRRVGSGNIGATNTLRTAGPLLGVLTLLLDMAKAAAGWLVAVHWLLPDGAPAWALGAALVAPVAGHCWTPWLGFRGGKGVASTLGVLLAADPRLAGIALAVFLVLAVPTRIVSLGSLAASLAAAIAGLLLPGAAPGLGGGTLVLAVIVWIRHRENLRRLLRGEERRIGGSRREDAR